MSLPPIAVVLAGERPGGNALARARGVRSALLMDLEGRALIDWALTAIANSGIERMLLVGPGNGLSESPAVRRWSEREEVDWVAPAPGPAASAIAGAERAGTWPLLLTSADHALLRPSTVREFCAKAQALASADVVVGLVPADRVRERFPDNQRTWLRFQDGDCCGSNLFYLRTPGALRALRFWQSLEALRKHPPRMAYKLGPLVLARYLAGLLTRDAALAHIGSRCEATIRAVLLDSAELAVDVDSPADYTLAAQVLRDRPAEQDE
ncbi:MAG: NTP transferase domain-containing protein [Pseudomonadota bacterium]